MSTRPSRLFHLSGFALLILAMAFGAGALWITRGAGGPAADSLRLLGLLVCCFIMELGLVFKLYGALHDCLPDPGRQDQFEPGRRERLLERTGLGVAAVGLVTLAYVLHQLPGQASIAAVRGLSEEAALVMARDASQVTAFGMVLANALLLVSVFLLATALVARFEPAPEEGGREITRIRKAPKLKD